MSSVMNSPVVQTIGWTLLHSLWFGLLCFSLTWMALRIIPGRRSNLRYGTAAAGVLLILISTIVSFIVLLPSETESAAAVEISAPFQLIDHAAQNSTANWSALPDLISGFINTNMPVIVLLWVTGALLTSLKVFGGYWYINRIRHEATAVGGMWEQKIQELADRVGVTRFVMLAESALIQAPVVLGYMKPVILVPVGMISGMTTAQLESIFIHELVHIRRGDYVVNIIQSFLEAIYFFNPFMWMLSSIMRREREHCCDDAVVEVNGNPLVYVRALATLEEARLSRAGVALSLADDRKQLLKRIKRLMEKSVQRYSGNEKLIPAILLVVGLACASWLSISNEPTTDSAYADNIDINLDDQHATAEDIALASEPIADTTIRDEVEYKHKRTIITIDADGNETRRVVEYDGEDDMDHGVMAPMEAMGIFDFNMAVPDPLMPPFDMTYPAVAPMDMAIVIPPVFNMPAMAFSPSDTTGPWHMQSSRDWDTFEQEFEKRFREKFGKFYEEHEGDMKEIMENLQSEFESSHEELQEQMMDMDEARQEAERMREEMADARVNREEERRSMKAQVEDFARQAADEQRIAIREMQRHSADLQRELATMQAKLSAEQSEHTGRMIAKMKEAEKTARKELVKDGYLKESEEIRSITINDDEIVVNGVKIKKGDERKYRKMLSVEDE